MARKCQPGVICIENVTLIIIMLILGFVIYYMYKTSQKNNVINENIYINPNDSGMFIRPNFGFTTQPGNVLLNPFAPPLKDTSIMLPSNDIRGGIPINVPTQGYVDTAYSQVGILTRVNGPEMILPLMGRRLLTNRDKWQYYCISDQNNNVKLPVSYNGKSCTGEYGCSNLYNGDTIYVEGYDSVFKVTMYENDKPRYIPFI